MGKLGGAPRKFAITLSDRKIGEDNEKAQRQQRRANKPATRVEKVRAYRKRSR